MSENEIIVKLCNRCNEEKDILMFYKKGNLTRPECKSCTNIVNKKYKKNNRQKINDLKKKYHQSDVGKQANKNFLLKYRETMPDEVRKKLKESHRNYCTNRYNSDDLYKLKVSIRNLIGLSFRKNKQVKTKKTIDIIGTSIEDFKLYIENLFQKDMSWKNYGKWHLDHIIPISWAKNKEEIIELNHYTNFKPMWGIDNIKKGNRYSESNQDKYEKN